MSKILLILISTINAMCIDKYVFLRRVTQEVFIKSFIFLNRISLILSGVEHFPVFIRICLKGCCTPRCVSKIKPVHKVHNAVISPSGCQTIRRRKVVMKWFWCNFIILYYYLFAASLFQAWSKHDWKTELTLQLFYLYQSHMFLLLNKLPDYAQYFSTWLHLFFKQ